MTENFNNNQSKSNEVVVSPPPEGATINLNEIIYRGLNSTTAPMEVLILEDGLFTPSEPIIIDKPLKMMARNSGKVVIKNENLTNLLTFSGDGTLILSGILFIIGNAEIQSNVVVIKSGSLEMSACGVGGAFDPETNKRDFGAGLLLLGDASAVVTNTLLKLSMLGISLQGKSSARIISSTFSQNRYGLVLRDKAQGDLQTNEFENNSETGVMVYDKASLTSSGDSSHDNKQGMGFLFDAKGTIENTACYENEYHGFFINDDSNVTLKGCKSYSNAYSGFAIYGDSHSNIQDCECYENAHSGFEIAEQAKTSLTNNKIWGNSDAGIYMDDTAEAQVIGNEIYENEVALDVNGQNTITIDKCKIHHNSIFLNYNDLSTVNQGENEVFENSGEEDEDEEEEEEGESVDLGSFLARLFGGASVSSDDDGDDDDDEDDDDDDDEDEEDDDGEQGNGSQSMFFGIGQNGEVTNMTNDGGGFSLSFTLDEDGEEIPEVRCPKCNKKGTHVWDPDNGIYKCDFCENEFIPEIYKALGSAEEYLNRAWHNFKQRNYKRTIKDCTSAIKLDPNSTLAYTVRGKAHGMREEYEEAEQDFSEAIRISPDDDNAHFSRGETRLHLEKFDDAIADLTASIGFDPNFATTYKFRALAYVKKDDYPQAINDLSEALQREPEDAGALCERGNCYAKIGEDDKALEDYTTSIELDPENPDAFMGRAELHEKHERFQEALTDYKNFLRAAGEEPTDEFVEKLNAIQLKIDPNSAPFTLDPEEEESIWGDVTLSDDSKKYRSEERGDKLLSQGDYVGAYKECSEFIAHQPKNVAAYIRRACVNFASGNLEGVIADFTGAINCGAAIYPQRGPFSDSVDPRYDQIYLLRALSYALAGQEENILPDLIADVKFGFEKTYISKNWSRHSSNLTANDAAASKFVRMVQKETENNRTPVQDALLARITKNVEAFGEAANLIIHNDPQNPILIWAFGLNQESNEDHPVIWDVPLSYPEDNAEMQFVRGLKSMTAGEIQRGKELILDAIRLDPDNADYYEKLGVFLYHAHQHDEATEYLTKAIELNPDSKDAYFTRGVSLDWKGETEAALADLEHAIALESKPGYLKTEAAQEKIQEIRESETKKQTLLSKIDPSAAKLGSASEYVARAEASLKEGKWDQAYVDLNEALKLEPNNANAYRFRGATYFKLGDSKSALKDYNQAISLDPNNSDLFLNRGILQADCGDSSNALSDLNEAIRLNPNNANAYNIRAQLHAKSWFNDDVDCLDQALEDFENAIQLEPEEPQFLVSRADFLGSCFRGAERDALADLDQAIRLAPDNAAYYLARHKVKLSLKDVNGAAEDLTKAYQLDPSDEEIKTLVQKLTAGSDKAQAAIYGQSGMNKFTDEDFEGCISDMSDAIKNDPSSEVYFSLRGFAYIQLDMYDEALSDFSEAVNLGTENVGVYEKRGMIYAERDQPDEALSDFDKAIGLGSEDAIVFLRRGFLHLEKQRFDEAIVDFTKSIDLDPTAMSYGARGSAYMQQKSYEDAISDLSKAIELDPDWDNAYLQRGFIYQELENFKSATQDYEVYLRITEDDDFREQITELINEWKDKESSEPSQNTEKVSTEQKRDSTSGDSLQASRETPKPPLSMTETWMQMGKAALDRGTYTEALNHFEKVVQEEPYNWEATIFKWRAFGGQTTFENEAWDEFFEHINQIKGYVLNRLTGKERKEALLLIAESVHWYTGLYMNLVKERRDKKLYDLQNQADINTLIGSSNLFLAGIARLEDSLSFLEGMEDEEFKTIKHQILKSKVNWITVLCEPTKAIMKPAMGGFAFVGIPEDLRSKYVTKYDTLVDEIMKVEPTYKPEKLIDRLSAPTSPNEALNRPAELAKLQSSIDKARQVQMYWESHPEEYFAHLEEEKRKKEEEKAKALAEEQRKAEERKARALAEQKRKQELFEERKLKLQKEIDEQNLKLEDLKRDTGREVERLRKERESLGFLAMGKKKEIDQKIVSLESQVTEFAAKIDSLRTQLRDLKP